MYKSWKVPGMMTMDGKTVLIRGPHQMVLRCTHDEAGTTISIALEGPRKGDGLQMSVPADKLVEWLREFAR